MKGLMVTLLVFAMTGTVIGQQPNQDAGLGRFILYLNDLDLRMLKSNPEGLSAPVAGNATGKLTEVRLRYGKQPTPAEAQSIEKKPGQFNLWLDDSVIAQLKANEEGLVADVPLALQDKIMEVLIKFGTNPNESTARQPSETTRRSTIPERDNGFDTTQFGARSSEKSTDNWALSLEEQLRRSKNEFLSNSNSNRRDTTTQDPVYGPPYIPREPPTTNRDLIGSSIAQNPRLETQNDNAGFRGRFNSLGQPTNRNSGVAPITLDDNRLARNTPISDSGVPETNLSPIVDNSDLEFQQELIRRKRQQLKEAQDARAAEERRQLARQVAEDNARLQNELYLEQIRRENRAQLEATTPVTREPRYASNDRDIIPNPSYNFPTRRSTAGPNDYDYNSIPPRQKFANSPRIAKSGGVNDYQMSIPANPDGKSAAGTPASTPLAKQTTHSNKAYGFIFFMLMLSLGLNLYLAWIARGFYVRYAELADELRETFTSSV